MCKRCNNRSAEDKKAFDEMVDLVRDMPVETVRDMYSCASGLVRYELKDAIKYLIDQGNPELFAKFPELRTLV